jgi:nucleotide-binding universal stress UspA family protein
MPWTSARLEVVGPVGGHRAWHEGRSGRVGFWGWVPALAFDPSVDDTSRQTIERRTLRERGGYMSEDAGTGVPTKIVVGTDGSPTAARAVRKAIALAAAVKADLIIVSAYNKRAPGGVAAAGISMDSAWVAAAQTAAETCAEEAGQQASAAGVAKLTCLAVAGEPSDALIDVTVEHHADLLVVGSKGMQSTARFLLGPIAKKVSRHVPCDLLIVETSE